MKYSYTFGGQIYTIEIDQIESGYRVSMDGKMYGVKTLRQSGSSDSAALLLEIDGKMVSVHVAAEENRRWAHFEGITYKLEKTARSRGGQDGEMSSENILRAPMPGQIRAVYVGIGDSIERGQTLLLLEAMKMEIRIQSPHDGKIGSLSVEVGDSVEKDQILIEVE